MYEITKSLLSAYQYMHGCYEGSEEAAEEAFLASLRRDPPIFTEAINDGLKFEDECYKYASGGIRLEHPTWESGIRKVGERIKGGVFQVRLSRPLKAAGTSFLCVGVLDVLRAGTIFDVKYKTKSFASLELAGSYLENPQHPMYFYLCPEAREFIYLVSDGSDLYEERYTPEDTQPVREIVEEFMDGISSMGLADLYREKWHVD